MPNTTPLEKDIESKVCAHAKKLGCLVYKFTSPARRSVPDRLFIMPEGRGVFFIEFKRKGQKPTTGQEIEIAKIKAQGTAVFVIDNVREGMETVDLMLGFTKEDSNGKPKKEFVRDQFGKIVGEMVYDLDDF